MDLNHRLSLESYCKRLKIDSSEVFLKFFPVTPFQFEYLLAEKKVQPRDLALFLVMMQHMHPQTGRVNFAASSLARLMNVSQSGVSLSLRRLQNCNLLVRHQDPRNGGIHFLLNPSMVACGSEKIRQRRAAEFHAIRTGEWIEPTDKERLQQTCEDMEFNTAGDLVLKADHDCENPIAVA
jgi:predicted transcriptional regulator